MFCIKCGCQLPDEAEFCPQCGSSVATTVSTVKKAVGSEANKKNDLNVRADLIKRLENTVCLDYTAPDSDINEKMNDVENDFVEFLDSWDKKISNKKMIYHPISKNKAIVGCEANLEAVTTCHVSDLVLISLDNKKWYVPAFDIMNKIKENELEFYLMFLDRSKVYHYSVADYFNMNRFWKDDAACTAFEILFTAHWRLPNVAEPSLAVESLTELSYSTEQEDPYNVANNRSDILNKTIFEIGNFDDIQGINESVLTTYSELINEFKCSNKDGLISPINEMHILKENDVYHRNEFISLGNLWLMSSDGYRWVYYERKKVYEAIKHNKHVYLTPFNFSKIYDLSKMKEKWLKKILRLFSKPIPFRIEKMEKDSVISLSEKFFPREKEYFGRKVEFFYNIPISFSSYYYKWDKLDNELESIVAEMCSQFEEEVANAREPFECWVNYINDALDQMLSLTSHYLANHGVPCTKDILAQYNAKELKNIFGYMEDASERYSKIMEKVLEAQSQHDINSALRPKVNLGGIGLAGILKGSVISSGINGVTSFVSNTRHNSKLIHYIDEQFAVYKKKENVETVKESLREVRRVLITFAAKNTDIYDLEAGYLYVKDYYRQYVHKGKEKLYVFSLLLSLDNREFRNIHKITTQCEQYYYPSFIFAEDVKCYGYAAQLENEIVSDTEEAYSLVSVEINKRIDKWTKAYENLNGCLNEKYESLFASNLKKLNSEYEKKKKCEEQIEKERQIFAKHKDFINKINDKLTLLFPDWCQKENFMNFNSLNNKSIEAKTIYNDLVKHKDADEVDELVYYKGLFYCYGFGTEVDFDKAKVCFRKIKDKFKGIGHYHLAEIAKILGNQKQYHEQMSYALDLLCPIAYGKVSEEITREGQNNWTNIDESLICYRGAMEADNRVSMVNLVEYRYKNVPTATKDETVDIIESVIRRHTPNDGVDLCLCYRLLYLYYDPENEDKSKVPTDKETSILYCEEAAKLGDSNAIEILKAIEDKINSFRVEANELLEKNLIAMYFGAHGLDYPREYIYNEIQNLIEKINKEEEVSDFTKAKLLVLKDYQDYLLQYNGKQYQSMDALKIDEESNSKKIEDINKWAKKKYLNFYDEMKKTGCEDFDRFVALHNLISNVVYDKEETIEQKTGIIGYVVIEQTMILKKCKNVQISVYGLVDSGREAGELYSKLTSGKSSEEQMRSKLMYIKKKGKYSRTSTVFFIEALEDEFKAKKIQTKKEVKGINSAVSTKTTINTQVQENKVELKEELSADLKKDTNTKKSNLKVQSNVDNLTIEKTPIPKEKNTKKRRGQNKFINAIFWIISAINILLAIGIFVNDEIIVSILFLFSGIILAPAFCRGNIHGIVRIIIAFSMFVGAVMFF